VLHDHRSTNARPFTAPTTRDAADPLASSRLLFPEGQKVRGQKSRDFCPQPDRRNIKNTAAEQHQ
jgi:hypothetical protein